MHGSREIRPAGRTAAIRLCLQVKLLIMRRMTEQKMKIAALLACMLMSTGCGSAAADSTPSASASASAPAETAAAATAAAKLTAADYSDYSAALDGMGTPDSYTAGVKCSYTMSYSDSSTSSYSLDGVLEVQDAAGDSPTAHMTQHISSDGMESDLEGYYYGGRLYNTYNTVTYYEDMSFSDLQKSMLVPLTPMKFSQDQISSLKQSRNASGTSYVVTLSDSAAADVFSSRYDFYGLKDYSSYAVQSGVITQSFGTDGSFVSETADFSASVSSSDSPVNVTFHSSVGDLRTGSTAVAITDDQKQAMAAYVSYKDIDTSKISSEDINSDTEEATVTDTFKKRLVNRLGYSVESDGRYKTTFNDTESYIIDFKLDQFTYSNMSSVYTYNWKGDNGGFGSSCSYDFTTDSSTSTCDSDVLAKIKEVKTYLQMELYYCGLSLEDLSAEAK